MTNREWARAESSGREKSASLSALCGREQRWGARGDYASGGGEGSMAKRENGCNSQFFVVEHKGRVFSGFQK